MQTRVAQAAVTVLVAAALLFLGGLAVDVAPAEAAGTVGALKA